MTEVATDPLVVFTPSGRRGRFPKGTTVLDAARQLGVDIDSVCGGHGLCGRCQVEPAAGQFAKHGISSAADHLSPAAALELEFASSRGMPADRRLGCLAEVRGDVVVDVPPESQVHRQVVRKDPTQRSFELDPVVRLCYVEVEPPELASASGDLARLRDALARLWDLVDLDADLDAIGRLQGALRAGGWKVTVAIHDDRAIGAAWPGFHDRAYGVAIDIGSTTIAAHLADLTTGEVLGSDGVMNPQIRYGEDLMSRVSYAMLHADGAAAMTKAVRGTVARLVAQVAKAAGVARDEILEVTLVGNPVMHHLYLGLDPLPLGQAPFALATDEAVRVPAARLGLPVNAGARAYVLPCIAGHVGADAAAVMLAETTHLARDIELVIDVGTNAEIVLGGPGVLLAASSPTGPAFEGAQISAGQRAAPGAIERVRIDRETLEPRFRVIGSERWSDEPAFLDATAETGVTGICGSGIVEVIAELFLAGVVTADGVIDGTLAVRSSRIVPDGRTFAYVLHEDTPRVLVTQADVRAIQLAKAAAYAGARLLMDHAGVETVDEVRLAGAFGSHIDPLHAMVLGLIPDCDLARVRSVGNAAGTGALICLLSGAARREIEAAVRRTTKVETAIEPRFQEHFVDALAFPNRTAPTPNLERVVELPARTGGTRPARGRRRGAASVGSAA
jgi:uncharacterized 2Fe-2S/4Fe-4S cluster protein (DUF4445 family)